MKKASIRDLHIRTSELVREAADGAVIVIDVKPRLPYMTNLWRRLPSVTGDSGRFLEEDR